MESVLSTRPACQLVGRGKRDRVVRGARARAAARRRCTRGGCAESRSAHCRGAAGMTPGSRTAPARVLVIEDNRNLATGLRNNLEIEGYVVELAADGASGLAAARASSPI